MSTQRDGKKRFVFKSKAENRVRGRLVSRDPKIRKRVGEIFGRYILLSIKEEIIKSYSLSKGIPRSKEFLDSFSFRVTDVGNVVIESDWKWVKRYLKTRGELKMTWLTASNPKLKSRVIPLKQKDGSINFRTVPLQTKNAWIHPSIEKYTFIERGIVKGKKRAVNEVMRYLKTEAKSL
tara:strand:- start:44 stop:577 length:534 start_codon:yes stop_codon:yes gene_type:complete